MSMPLIISIIIAIVAIVFIILGITLNDDGLSEPLLAVGLVVFVANTLLGFGVACCETEVTVLPATYMTPESIFQDDNYLIVVFEGQTFMLNEARHLNNAKDGIVKIQNQKSLNAYGILTEDRNTVMIFTKEEWEKISTTILEKNDETQKVRNN